MDAVIGTHIAIRREALPQALEQDIRAALSIANPDKDRALSEHIRGAENMADELHLWAENPAVLFLPRGFVHELEGLARKHDEEITWEQHMTFRPEANCFLWWRAAELRDYQERARDDMLGWANGIMRAPTAAGKTRVALEVARLAGQPTLVIVDKTALADQWITAIKTSYDDDAGLIGDGKWEPRDITVALRQTLWARRDEIPEEFWNSWGMLILDEVHHASSETLVDLIQRFPAYYRLGYSATPEWDEQLFPFVEAVVGPVVHRTTPADVGENLVTPRVVTVPTSFDFGFIPTHFQGRRRIQNNYGSMMDALCSDRERNELIANTVMCEAREEHHVLITTRRVEHVERLARELETLLGVTNPWRSDEQQIGLFVLIGKSSKQYEQVRQAIANATGGTILISTIADEALDIPRLDRLIMAFPARRVPLVEQQIGRIVRPAPGKIDAIVFDIYDEKIGVMKGQFRDRSQQLYMRRRWPMERRELAEVAASTGDPYGDALEEKRIAGVLSNDSDLQ